MSGSDPSAVPVSVVVDDDDALRLPDEILDEYLRVCYHWRVPEPTAEALNPEDEEFAESDTDLRQRVRIDEGFRRDLLAKVRGRLPLHEHLEGGLMMRTWVRGSAPVPDIVTEVTPVSGECGRWRPGEGGWPAAMRFGTRPLERHAGQLWSASLAVASLLLGGEALVSRLLRPGARVLELGAGPGFLGAVLALMGCQDMTLTDHPDCGDFAAENARANLPPDLQAAVRHVPLDWAQPLPLEVADRCPWDVVVCSDCLYYEQTHRALCDTLKALACGSESVVLFAYETRNLASEAEFREFLRPSFTSEAIRRSPSQAEDMRLMLLRPRKPDG